MKVLRKMITLVLVLLLCGCTSAKQYTAYTIYPIGYLLSRIGGNRIQPITIQNRTLVQCANLVDNYEEILSDSSVLFHIGNLEPYMDLYDDEIKALGIDLAAGDLSVLNCLYEYKRYTPVIVDNKVSFVEGPYYESDLFNDIDTYDLDPFIWLSPSGMYCMAKDVYEYLSNNYVEQSSYFTENYKQIADELIALDASYQALAAKLVKENKTIKFVSMTGSFGCWQKDFGFQVYPVCLSKYGALPSQAQLEAIKTRIRNDDVQFIAYEPNMPQQMLELMAQLEEEMGLKRITLHNISSLTNTQIESGKDYLSLMYENLSVLESIAATISQTPAPAQTQETPVEGE
ncbi:MAG: zinc ABC transporter substrate-binding protein [Erysipelotrichaceae bacterium]|nr:zinc ABC transporter substrate-binding protein [Erysipelotrichaceae bacterium]